MQVACLSPTLVGGGAWLDKCLHLGCHWSQPGVSSASLEEHHTLNPSALYHLPFYFQRPKLFGLNYSNVELPLFFCALVVKGLAFACVVCLKARPFTSLHCVCINSCVLGFSLKKKKKACSAVVRLINSALLVFLSSCLELRNCSCLALHGLDFFQTTWNIQPWMGVAEMLIWLLKSNGLLRFVVALLLWRKF